jgi:hypothetical protein
MSDTVTAADHIARLREMYERMGGMDPHDLNQFHALWLAFGREIAALEDLDRRLAALERAYRNGTGLA